MFVDLFIKWVEIISIKKVNGKTIECEFHKRIISRWRSPRVRHTVNGTEFVNKAKYYPQTNPTELYNRTIKQIIKAYLQNDHATWDDNVDDLKFAINTSKNASTQ